MWAATMICPLAATSGCPYTANSSLNGRTVVKRVAPRAVAMGDFDRIDGGYMSDADESIARGDLLGAGIDVCDLSS